MQKRFAALLLILTLVPVTVLKAGGQEDRPGLSKTAGFPELLLFAAKLARGRRNGRLPVRPMRRGITLLSPRSSIVSSPAP